MTVTHLVVVYFYNMQPLLNAFFFFFQEGLESLGSECVILAQRKQRGGKFGWGNRCVSAEEERCLVVKEQTRVPSQDFLPWPGQKNKTKRDGCALWLFTLTWRGIFCSFPPLALLLQQERYSGTPTFYVTTPSEGARALGLPWPLTPGSFIPNPSFWFQSDLIPQSSNLWVKTNVYSESNYAIKSFEKWHVC